MSSGPPPISTTNLPLAASLIELFGHEDLGGGKKRTARLALAALAKLIAVPTGQVTTRLLSDLTAMLGYPANTGAYVVADPDLTKRGIYIKIGASGAGSWTRVADLPVYDFGDEVQTLDDVNGFAVADPSGFVGLLLDGDGLHLGGVTFGQFDGGAFAVADEAGFIGLLQTSSGRLLAGGIEGGSGGSTSSYSTSELSERNARALALSGAIRDGSNAAIAAPIWGYTHLLWYGQSLGVGTEAYPAKSKTVRTDVLMLGDSVRPLSEGTTTYNVVGSATLKPLKACVQPGGSGGAPLSDAQVAALGRDSQAAGESPAEGASRFARLLWLKHHGLQTDASRLLVVSNASSGGRPVEELSKGAEPELFNRLRSAVSQVRAAIASTGKSHGIGALFYLQGEANYSGVRGGTQTLAGYKAVLGKLYDDFLSDVVAGIGQADPPPMITYQTSGTWVANGLAIGQAQYELSLERPGWYLAAPSYPVTDKGGHLDPNGSRWLGLQMGKVYHEVAVRRRGWRPTSPLQATWRGNAVLIAMHAPVPPLQFRPVYMISSPVMYLHKGFSVADDLGDAGISSVVIVADTLVQITCNRALSGSVRVFYGQRTGYLGAGNLCDSDPTIAPDVYEYSPGSGDYEEANIPELVDKPYPLQNWCVNFSIIAAAD